jgi:hypothetical protein
MNYMQGNQTVAAYSNANGTQSLVYSPIGTGFWSHSGWPTVPTPRYNYAQGEVHAYDTDYYGYPWLNDCSGEQFSLQYQDGSSGLWYNWGSLTVAAGSPYFATKQANYLYTNGGGARREDVTFTRILRGLGRLRYRRLNCA